MKWHKICLRGVQNSYENWVFAHLLLLHARIAKNTKALLKKAILILFAFPDFPMNAVVMSVRISKVVQMEDVELLTLLKIR